MKTLSPAGGAAALAALCSKDRLLVERSLGHLTSDRLRELEDRLLAELRQLSPDGSHEDDNANGPTRQQQMIDECHLAVATACVRRNTYRCLDKFSSLPAGREVVEDALRCHSLPKGLRDELVERHGHQSPPATWHEALEQLREMATGENRTLDGSRLWELILDHPMTAYVPVQCGKCGKIVPDETDPRLSDADVGLREVPPSGDEPGLRSGWFRGPRAPVVFELTCIECGHESRWYRSGHPKNLLDPNGRGRLCGEQEDLRLILASYLGIEVRLVLPLDWDHVWSEFRGGRGGDSDEDSDKNGLDDSASWNVRDGSARNFCRRLDEGIGSWTGVLAVHPDPELCSDVTGDYLNYRRDRGRADDGDDFDMERYRSTVREARLDSTGGLTQAKTVVGYVLERAGLSSEDVTALIRQAAADHRDGTEWWRI